ncbi:MAG: DNA ligase [Campylobacterales bacterium]|nr:DNA ligase [Campylobacterales bacterium]
MKFLLLLVPFLLWAQKPELPLLKTYKDQNISGWVMSEKLDGIRAYWDGEKLLSRSGKVIHAPKWFLQGYPPFAVDGELWSGRGEFEKIISIVRDSLPSEDWREIKHYIFEVPDVDGNLYERMEKLKPYVSDRLKMVTQIEVKSKAHLAVFLKKVEAKGGEGVVVRDPNTPYIAKRTDKALKVKSFLDDECEVVGYTKGKGKYEGLIGALRCRLRNGTLFQIGSGFSNDEKTNPPAIGDIITFQYKELTKYKKPRFPIFLRVRYKKDETMLK